MSGRRVAGLILAAVWLHLVLILPNHPGAMTLGALRMVPLELPLLLVLMMALPARGRLTGWVIGLVAAFLTLMIAIKLADFATFVSYNRRFNPVLDFHLLHAVWMLGSGAIGTIPMLGVIVGALLGLGLAAWASWRALRCWAGLLPVGRLRLSAAALALPLLALVVADILRPGGWRPPGDAWTTRLATEHARFLGVALADRRDFRDRAAEDAWAATPHERILDRLAGVDVVILFVESYGRAALQNPRYADTILPRLDAIEADLTEAGLGIRSGWATAPMIGGQSWLAHASILSGLWIDTQPRYQTLMASPRRTLMHFAQKAGFETSAVMPAITLPWPESGYFGFDRIYESHDLGYAGEPFNWVTMPDQFTLKAFERLEIARPDRGPIFNMTALISSHAPWTPIAPILDWDAIGDGSVFTPYARAGDPPEVVWRDRDRIRDMYRQSVDYALAVTGAFIARHADRDMLWIVLGDHEPAQFVIEIDSFDVPLHVIGPPEVLEAIADWGFTPAMTPAADAPVWRMDAFRDRFLSAFSSVGPEDQTADAARTARSGASGMQTEDIR